jgi:4-carboxymuconolactone decarboxylase
MKRIPSTAASVTPSLWLCAAATLLWFPLKSAAQQAPAGPATSQEEYNASLPPDVYPDSRSRIPLADRDDLDEEGKRIYDDRVSPDSTSLAGLQGPGGLRLHGSGGDAIGSGLAARLQELARLVVAREMDQQFEWTVHEPVALKEGLQPEIIDVIRHRKPLDGVPEKEAAIIQLGREIFQNHKVSSETFAKALKQLGRRNLIDLCDLMGRYTTTAILLHTVDLHLPYDRPSLLPVP